MPTAALKSNEFLLKLASTASGSDYAAVVAGRELSLVINGSDIDITNKGSGGFSELLDEGGVTSMTVSVSGVFTDETSQTLLQTIALERKLWNMQLAYGGNTGKTVTGKFKVSNFTISGGSDDAVTFEASLTSSGAVVIDDAA